MIFQARIFDAEEEEEKERQDKRKRIKEAQVFRRVVTYGRHPDHNL